MKYILRTIFPAVLLVMFLGNSALAQTKIATVDMRRLFENYWRTKQAQAALQDRSAQLDKDDKSMKDDFTKATDDYKQLLAKANDTAISADERDRRSKAAADKLKQLEDSRAKIQEFEQTAQSTLSDQLQHMSEKILAEIQTVVNAKAKAGGYTMVLNSAAETINLGTAKFNVPSPVVYSVSDVDLTLDVLKQLNAGAPIDLSTLSNSVPVALPVSTLLKTNGP